MRVLEISSVKNVTLSGVTAFVHRYSQTNIHSLRSARLYGVFRAVILARGHGMFTWLLRRYPDYCSELSTVDIVSH